MQNPCACCMIALASRMPATVRPQSLKPVGDDTSQNSRHKHEQADMRRCKYSKSPTATCPKTEDPSGFEALILGNPAPRAGDVKHPSNFTSTKGPGFSVLPVCLQGSPDSDRPTSAVNWWHGPRRHFPVRPYPREKAASRKGASV